MLSAVVQEGLIGVAIGFAVLLVFQGLESAGSLVGVSMGMGLGRVFDR